MQKLALIIIASVICCCHAIGQKNRSVILSIPKEPGLTGISYISFKIKDTMLYVYDNGDSNIITSKSKVLAIYPVAQNYLRRLDSAVANIDSLKRFVNRCAGSQYGWPRFYIMIETNDRRLTGFVASVYRKSIFDIVDIFNDAYPKGDIISYNRAELILKEKDCREPAVKKLK